MPLAASRRAPFIADGPCIPFLPPGDCWGGPLPWCGCIHLIFREPVGLGAIAWPRGSGGEPPLHPLPLPLGSPRYRWGWVVFAALGSIMHLCIDVSSQNCIGVVVFRPITRKAKITCITMQNCIESVPMENITDILAELRKSHSQSELSRLTGISQSKLSRWEAGQVADGADDALKLLALAKSKAATSPDAKLVTAREVA